MNTNAQTNACDNILNRLESPDYGNVKSLVQEIVEIVRPGFIITMESILSVDEKTNIELKKRIRRTNATIRRTQNSIKYLMDMNIQTIESLYEAA